MTLSWEWIKSKASRALSSGPTPMRRFMSSTRRTLAVLGALEIYPFIISPRNQLRSARRLVRLQLSTRVAYPSLEHLGIQLVSRDGQQVATANRPQHRPTIPVERLK